MKFIKENWKGLLVYFILAILFMLAILAPKACWTPTGITFR